MGEASGKTRAMNGEITCNINYSDGREIERVGHVSGDTNKDYLACLINSLTTMKDDINSLLTEQVTIEKETRLKRHTPDDEGTRNKNVMFQLCIDLEELDLPESKSSKT